MVRSGRFRVRPRRAGRREPRETEVLIGALSRTQLSQLEAREGLELRLWVLTGSSSR